MTPDREPGEAVLQREVETSTSEPAPGTKAVAPAHDAPAAGTVEAAREAAVAAGPVPAPRPEVLARVLDGLRDLPAARHSARAPAGGPADGPAMPLPRRRS